MSILKMYFTYLLNMAIHSMYIRTCLAIIFATIIQIPIVQAQAQPLNCEMVRMSYEAQGIPKEQWPDCTGIKPRPDCKTLIKYYQTQGISKEQWPTCTDIDEKCSCLGNNMQTCKFILDGYKIGDFQHPLLPNFARTIATAINDGSRITALEYKGYADGTSDVNGAGKWENVTYKACKKQTSGKYFDPELAELRRCIARHVIENTTGTSIMPATKELQFDFENNAENALPRFRKIEITITKHETCQ